MSNKPIYIGIAGLAGSGKDTFFKYLSSTLQKSAFRVKRYSFGDELKTEIKDWCLENYGIDPNNCSIEEKDYIRDILIAHARIKRKQTNGKYWIDKTKQTIKNENLNLDYICITDVRYNTSYEDEVAFIKDNNGVVVYVSRFKYDEDANKVYLRALNEEEEINDPMVKQSADYTVTIREVYRKEDVEEVLMEQVEEFIKWMEQRITQTKS